MCVRYKDCVCCGLRIGCIIITIIYAIQEIFRIVLIVSVSRVPNRVAKNLKFATLISSAILLVISVLMCVFLFFGAILQSRPAIKIALILQVLVTLATTGILVAPLVWLWLISKFELLYFGLGFTAVALIIGGTVYCTEVFGALEPIPVNRLFPNTSVLAFIKVTL